MNIIIMIIGIATKKFQFSKTEIHFIHLQKVIVTRSHRARYSLTFFSFTFHPKISIW